MTTITVPIHKIIPDPSQPRKHSGFDEESIRQMADGILRVGIIHDITVTEQPDQNYMIVVGERRYRAALMAGLVELNVKVVDVDPDTRLEMQLIEDISRKDIDVRDRAASLQTYVKKHPDQKAAAAALGMSAARLSQLLELTQLQPEVSALIEKKLTRDSSTLVLANKLAKQAPEKLAELVQAAESAGRKITRKDMVAAASPYSKKRGKSAPENAPSESDGTANTSPPDIPCEGGHTNLEIDVANVVEESPVQQASLPGFEKVQPTKLKRVRTILRVPETASASDLIERLVEELLRREGVTA